MQFIDFINLVNPCDHMGTKSENTNQMGPQVNYRLPIKYFFLN